MGVIRAAGGGNAGSLCPEKCVARAEARTQRQPGSQGLGGRKS